MDEDTAVSEDPGRTWRIGEMAAETGLTVRTLRYYDTLGLLAPSFRSAAGHRRYTAADLRRIQQIVAMRGLGFSLDRIGLVLAAESGDPRDLVRGQLGEVERQITAALRVRRTLHGVLGLLDHSPEPTTQTFLDLLEVMTAMERSLTPAEVEQMARGRQRMIERLTPEQLAEINRRRRRTHELLTPQERAELVESRAARIGPRRQKAPDA